MNVGQLKKILEQHPEDMPVSLFDRMTDDFYLGTYNLEEADISPLDYVEEEDGEVVGKMLAIGFDNKLNDGPI